jgi:DNA mismatch endonuclease (patch repair protein)
MASESKDTRKKERTTPSFSGRRPASVAASRAAQGASKKVNTRCELVLRQALWHAGFRYRLKVQGLAGRPDLVFLRKRVAVFCDGDFWHGRNLDSRLARLVRGHNASYWMEKIRTNVRRDRAVSERLAAEGWHVVRLWETDILRDPTGVAVVVAAHLRTVGAEAPNNRLYRTVRCAVRR